MRTRTILEIVFLCVILPTVCFADGPYYVDNAASGSNNGSSWTNAWQSFAAINWTTVAAGSNRTVYISGGTVSKEYNERLAPSSSGTSGNPITIRPGQESPHNGTVIIDTNDSAALFYSLKIDSVSYITIDGRVGVSTTPKIKITDAYYAGIAVSGAAADDIILSYLEICENGDYDYAIGFNQGTGVIIASSVTAAGAVELHHCVLHTNGPDQDIITSWTNACTSYGRVLIHDNELYNGAENSISAYGCGTDIYDNWFHTPVFPITAGHEPHYNSIQMNASYQRVWNNFFDDFPPEGRTIDAPIRYNPDVTGGLSFGHIRIFNNLFVSTTALTNSVGDPQTMPFITLSFSDLKGGSITDVLVSNNTLVGSPGYALCISTSSASTATNTNNIFILNNIFYNSARTEEVVAKFYYTTGTGITYGSYGDGDVGTLDYNIFWPTADGVNSIYLGATGYTWANFRTATGAEDLGQYADPLLDSSYKPTASSPGNNTGINLTSYCTETPTLCYDKDGNARPSSGAWDIGAYEYTTGTTPPSATGCTISGGLFR